MKILVMSDSHRKKDSMLEAIRLENPDLIVHLGDHDADCTVITEQFPQIPLRTVKGNCDPRSTAPEDDEFELEGVKFFITHGHLHGVKSGSAQIVEAARQKGADVLLFGHTHIPYQTTMQGLVLINPGSIGEKIYAVLEPKNGAVDYKIKEVP